MILCRTWLILKSLMGGADDCGRKMWRVWIVALRLAFVPGHVPLLSLHNPPFMPTFKKDPNIARMALPFFSNTLLLIRH